MSHFTVLVIGDNPERQLAPFNEEDFYSEEGREETFTCAPKWDWYRLGGRWTGFFKMKPGIEGLTGEPGILTKEAEDGYADCCLKCHIDFQSMRDEAAAGALARWDKAHGLMGEHYQTYESWGVIRERHALDIEKAREAYHTQPAVVALKTDDEFVWAHDDVMCSREEMERRARVNAAIPFAILKDGVWYERGTMGWWGIVSDEKDRDVWAEEASKLLDELPDSTMLSLYDCHI